MGDVMKKWEIMLYATIGYIVFVGSLLWATGKF